jgi:hypothetical protein
MTPDWFALEDDREESINREFPPGTDLAWETLRTGRDPADQATWPEGEWEDATTPTER